MIYLYSATPGTGKTCYVVKQLIEHWTKDVKYKDRKIYANIDGLKIEGIEPAPDDFRECEDGSIIIYDEAQDIKHYSSETRDDPVARALSKHRHRGFDIHMITQDPALLNKWVLKNVYMHYYLWRPAQSQNITIYTFARAIVTPTKQDFKTAFDKRLWRFEKYYLQFYKSTVINTSEKVQSTKKAGIITTGIVLSIVIAYCIRPFFAPNNMLSDPVTNNHPKIRQDTPTNETTNAIKTQQEQSSYNPTTLPQNTPQSQLETINAQIELIQAQIRLQELQRQTQLYNQMLVQDYAIIKSDPNLQVRGVISDEKKCNAYNTHGDLMTLTFDECNYYLEEAGRVHKATSQNERTMINSEQSLKN